VTAGPVRALRAAGRVLRRPYYRARPRLWLQPLEILDQRSLVSLGHRYLYLRVPKAANTTVTRALLEHCPEPGLMASDLERDDLGGAKRRVAHLGDLGRADARALAGFFIFTVVRDPYARTLSAYLDKFKPGDKHLDRFGQQVAVHDGGKVSFRGFCRYLAAGGEKENAHWMRQTRITGLADRLDAVGKVETLEADLRAILEGICDAASGSFARAGPPATNATARLAEHYDAECRAIVERVYAADFAAFGYRPLS
jgi:hypothetical protein